MKCKLLVPQPGPNPEFDRRRAAELRQLGKVYDVPHTIELPVGHEIEHQQAWRLCCPGARNSPPVAEPIDDECRERVAYWMEQVRPKRLAQLRATIENPPPNLSDGAKEHLKQLGGDYGIDTSAL